MDLFLATTLRALMQKMVWTQFQHLLNEDSFPNTNTVAIYTLLEGLHKVNKKGISEHSLRAAMEANVRGADRRVELHRVIDAMMKVKKRDLGQANHIIRQYLARGYGERAIEYWVTHNSDVAFDHAIPAALFQRACSIVQVTDEPTVAGRAAGLPGDNDMVRHTVGLGYSSDLDRALFGGIGRGELGILLAPPARGKTSYLVAAATAAVEQGEQVLYFTLEIRKDKVFMRYYQTLTHLDYMELMHAGKLIDARRNEVKGELHVADYSKSQLTPSLVGAEIEYWREVNKVPISHVIIDYAELMDPTGGYGKLGATARAMGDMTKDLRRIAGKYDVPVLSAWQVNRGGADKYIFTEADISECWEVVKHADIILGLNQGPQDMADSVMRLKVLKQRESPARPVIYLHSDMVRNVIRPIEDTEVKNGSSQASDGPAVDGGSGPRVSVHRSGIAG